MLWFDGFGPDPQRRTVGDAGRQDRPLPEIGRQSHAAELLHGFLDAVESTQSATTAKDLMRRPITCDIDLPLRDAIDLIIRNEVHRVVVTDSSTADAAPAGILSTSDVIREMAQEGSVWEVG